MTDIIRNPGNPRLSRSVVHNGIVYLTGTSTLEGNDIKSQTRDVLRKIDGYLAAAGSDKTRLLQAQIWLKDIKRDFAGMNAVWTEWVDPAHLPARATCQAELAEEGELIEVIVIATTTNRT